MRLPVVKFKSQNLFRRKKPVLNPNKPTNLTRPRPQFSWGRALWAVLVTIVAAMLIHSLLTNQNFRWDVVGQYLFSPVIVEGIMFTLLLTVGAMLIGVILAVTMAIMRQSANPIMKAVAWFYIWFFRGTPIYTQLIFWGLLPTLYRQLSLGIPFGYEFIKFDTDLLFQAGISAVIGLGLNEGAYLSEIVRSGLNAVDPGQSEAATALGMRRGQILRRVVIPQAMRVIVPPTGNETISMLKTTSLVSAVPFTLELTYQAQVIGNRQFLPIPLLIVAAIWYLVITSILMIGQTYLERYYGRGFDASGKKASDKRKLRFTPRKQRAMATAHTTREDPFSDVTP